LFDEFHAYLTEKQVEGRVMRLETLGDSVPTLTVSGHLTAGRRDCPELLQIPLHLHAEPGVHLLCVIATL
jgi:hypothetical protein